MDARGKVARRHTSERKRKIKEESNREREREACKVLGIVQKHDAAWFELDPEVCVPPPGKLAEYFTEY